MAIYGLDQYGSTTYGNTVLPEYRVDPFTAVPVNYDSVSISWQPPTGSILGYRLVKNMFGPPTDQDDGEILIDTVAGYPGNQFTDTNIRPGMFHYYGFFLLIDLMNDVWVKSAITACLAVKNYESGSWINSLIPSFFSNGSNTTILEDIASDSGNTFLDKFTSVLGWGIDYLRTQYDTYLNTNNPWTIPPADLWNLARQLGLDINPDIHPYTLRKAIYYNAIVNKQRGTQQGIDTELSALTGWNADIQIGRNFMLENDQSMFLHPVFDPWSAYLAYTIGEMVSYGNFWYQCIATGNRGNAPTGTSSSNTWWQPILSVNNATYLLNAITGGINTWELIYPSATNGTPAASSFFETLGVADPLNAAVFSFNSLQGVNKSGSTGTVWLRSVSRSASDMITVTTTFAPNKDQVVGNAIPVPYSLPTQVWNPSVRYGTNDIVTYNNQPFIALRASTGITPPYSSIGSVSAEWAPVSFEQRYRIAISAYLTGSSAVPATPFCEWYDASGNFIMRIFARDASLPVQFAYDSFVTGSGTYLNGRTTDDSSSQWTNNTGSFSLSPFGTGSVYPSVTGQRTLATLSVGSANCQVGITFVTNPQAGQSEGIILRYQNDNNYLRADQTTLRLKSSGVWSTLGTYSTPCSPGDRLVAQLNGTSITILRNGVSVLSVTNSFNTSGTTHGIIVENT